MQLAEPTRRLEFMHEFRLGLAEQLQKVPSPDLSLDSPNTNGYRRLWRN